MLAMELGSLGMERKMPHGIRKRAETLATAPAAGGASPSPARCPER